MLEKLKLNLPPPFLDFVPSRLYPAFWPGGEGEGGRSVCDRILNPPDFL